MHRRISEAAAFVLLSGKKPVDNLLLCFRFGQTQGHQLDDLFAGDFPDCRFVDQRGVHMIRVKLRDGRLADIAPTTLDLMGLEKPAEMDGETLIEN